MSASVPSAIILPDLRGHGLSVLGNPGNVAYLGQYEDDLSDLFEHLKLSYPAAKLVLGGHSSGGGFAIRYAGKHPEYVAACLLLAPYLGHRSPTVRQDSGGWVQVANRRNAGLAMLNNLKIRGLNRLPVLFFNRPEAINDNYQLETYPYRLNESFSLPSYKAGLGRLEHATLVLVGTDDEAFNVEAFEPLLQKYAPHAELSFVAGVKHLDIVNSEQTLAYVSD